MIKNLFIIGFGNVSKEFFKTLIFKFSNNNFKVFLVFRTNNYLYKSLAENFLKSSSCFVFVFLTYKSFITLKYSLVIELIGDNYYSKDIMFRVLKSKNFLLTANKNMLYKNIRLIRYFLFVRIFFEASIGGGVPFIKNFFSVSSYSYIKSFFSILNGTTNFLLSNLYFNNFTFSYSLFLSTKFGLSESNPVKDLSGLDSLNKLILSSFLLFYNLYYYDNFIYLLSLPLNDFFYSLIFFLGFLIKYISFYIIKGISFYLEVSPILFRQHNFYTQTDYEYNCISFFTKKIGKFSFFAKGAGNKVTTYSLFSDFDFILNKRTLNSSFLTRVFSYKSLFYLSLLSTYYFFYFKIFFFYDFLYVVFRFCYSVSFLFIDFNFVVVFFKKKINLVRLKSLFLSLGFNVFNFFRVL